MGAVKPALASKTVIANLVTALLPLLGWFGVNLGSDDQTALGNNVADLIYLGFSLATTLSALIGIYGRLRANTRIGGWITAQPEKAPPPSPPPPAPAPAILRP